MLYCNKLQFKKFFPRINETQEETSHSLRFFVEIKGLPAALHSDNYNNLKTGLFKKTLRKFGIWSRGPYGKIGQSMPFGQTPCEETHASDINACKAMVFLL